MQGKTIVTNILSFVILLIGAYSGLFSAAVAAWLGVASFTISLVLQSGVISSGTNQLPIAQLVVLLAGIALQVLGYIRDQSLVSATVINGVITFISLFIQTFFKDYGSGAIVKLK